MYFNDLKYLYLYKKKRIFSINPGHTTYKSIVVMYFIMYLIIYVKSYSREFIVCSAAFGFMNSAFHLYVQLRHRAGRKLTQLIFSFVSC